MPSANLDLVRHRLPLTPHGFEGFLGEIRGSSFRVTLLLSVEQRGRGHFV
jgi:hypothetical protein